MSNKRKIIDKTYQGLTFFAASIAVITLSLIFFYVFSNGVKLLNWELVVSDYHAHVYNGEVHDSTFSTLELPQNVDDIYYSQKWGIGLQDGIDREGKPMITVAYVADDSPLLDMTDRNNERQQLAIEVGNTITSIKFYDQPSALSLYGANNMVSLLDAVDEFKEITYSSLGGGIRGSLITTLDLIGLTLLFALPIGIFTAIYLNEYAKKNVITSLLRNLIETLTGVPSIVFGLMGLAVFVPLTVQYTKAESANLISGSLTLAVILLPVIIRSTEESLKVVPNDYRSASLALGANHTQTTFKVVLPSALPGILTATLLAIGRIIGESAALIFAIGTSVKDDISIFGRSTSLAVHIWSLMTDEPANIELASTIAIIILIIVLSLNIIIKLISKHFMKRFG
jgi:phosphate transport system permease protein